MKPNKLIVAAAMLAACMAFAVPASAQDAGKFYLGLSVGQSNAKDGCTGLSGPGISCEDTDTAFGITGGYWFTRNIALEVGYHDFGKFKASGPGGSAEIAGTAYEVVGVASYPASETMSIYGKLGFYSGEAKLSSSIGISGKDTNTDATYGFGLQYNVNPSLGIRGEYRVYSSLGGSTVGESDVDVFSVGALWNF